MQALAFTLHVLNRSLPRMPWVRCQPWDVIACKNINVVDACLLITTTLKRGLDGSLPSVNPQFVFSFVCLLSIHPTFVFSCLLSIYVYVCLLSIYPTFVFSFSLSIYPIILTARILKTSIGCMHVFHVQCLYVLSMERKLREAWAEPGRVGGVGWGK